jgi:hypothetical protein
MRCPKCGSRSVLVEALGDGKTRLICQNCRHQEVRDSQGRGLLTDDMPRPDRRQLITS